MSDKVKMIVVGVVALLVGAAGGGGYGMMQVDEVKQQLMAAIQEKEGAEQMAAGLRIKNENATKKWGTELGKLVAAAPLMAAPAVTPATDPASAPAPAPMPEAVLADPKVIDSARAILAARDGFRGALDGARAAMNSEFDQLALELGQPVPDTAKVSAIVQSLQQNWPHKEQDLQAAAHQLLADLDILPPLPKPAEPVAAPADAAPAALPPVVAPAPEPAK